MENFCGKCGSRLDPQTGLCPKCDQERIKTKQTRQGPKHRFGRPFTIALMIILLLAATLGAACGFSHLGIIRLPSFLCLHEWQNATCTSPKTCRLCGKTEGEALGHDWQAATCTTMQSCRVCGATKGTPLGHKPGAWDETIDILHASQHRERMCTVCGTVLRSYDQPLTSFIQNDLFLFSPQEFLDRLESFAKKSYPDFRYTFDTVTVANVGDAFFARLYLDESSPTAYGLSFVGASGTYLNQNDLNTSGVLRVYLEKMCEIDVKTGDGLDPIDFKLAEAFYHACDPVISEDDLYQQQVMHICTFANWIDNSEPTGYNEINGVQYAFQYAISKSGAQYLDIESIRACSAQ